jgi:hypothetical protein
MQIVVCDSDPTRVKWLKSILGKNKVSAIDSLRDFKFESPSLLITGLSANDIAPYVGHEIEKSNKMAVLSWCHTPCGFTELFVGTPVTRAWFPFGQEGLDRLIQSYACLTDLL